MPKEINFLDEFYAFKDALFLHDDGYRFIKFHKIWKGFNRYGWASKVLMLIGLLVSFSFLAIIVHWVQGVFGEGSGIVANTSAMFAEMKELFFLEGGIKYLILIGVEILIFHCSVNTINILNGQNRVPVFQDFVAAEKRMIMVVFRSYILEMILTVLITTVLKIVGLDFFKFIPIFFVHAYFIGFTFFDNYNEQYGFNIKESTKQINQRIGAVIGIGMVAVLLLKIPVIGAIAAPILGATTATMYLYGEGVHWPSLPRIFHEDKLKLKPIKKKLKLKA